MRKQGRGGQGKRGTRVPGERAQSSIGFIYVEKIKKKKKRRKREREREREKGRRSKMRP